MSTVYVNWGGAKVKLTWNANNILPQYNLMTSAHGFCFKNNELLLVNLNHRGWDFPGGHIEKSETPEECFIRETREEGYVEGKCRLLGYITVDHSENDLWSEDSKYPKIGYQIFYGMDIEKVLPFDGEYESSKRIFINSDDISSFYQEWNPLYQEILDYATQ